jgi:hypothetical protein
MAEAEFSAMVNALADQYDGATFDESAMPNWERRA